MAQLSVEGARTARVDLERCKALLRDGSRSFFAASRLLPDDVRDPATALYAFCRVADDIVDRGIAGDDGVARLRDRLDRVYRGTPLPRCTDRAFADVISRWSIPRELPLALLEGLEWDVQQRRYEDLPGLMDYAARVAASVGAMMALLMGVRSAGLIARACDLGIAMQLTNIARDVGEDAAMRRIYLPLSWLREAGVDPDDWLARPVFDGRIAQVVERLLRAADELYARADSGIARLPRGCRPGIRTARLVYASIGREVARRGYDSVTQRAYVPGRQKLALVARSLFPLAHAADAVDLPPLPATRYLVEAASAAPQAKSLRNPSLGERFIWALELFERLERAELGVEGRRTRP